MKYTTSKKKEECQHEEYCGFSETVCVETDFQEHCSMKDEDIKKMPLLKTVKDRVERDKLREEAKKEK